ncbi:MAG: hypothetical protein OXH02_01615 [Gemmatimonadetes bacterium]|nr:hypothetical protein [Gemmatimonadota bacterium]
MLAPLFAALVRHAIFAIALPWLILYRTAGMEEMRFDSEDRPDRPDSVPHQYFLLSPT